MLQLLLLRRSELFAVVAPVVDTSAIAESRECCFQCVSLGMAVPLRDCD